MTAAVILPRGLKLSCSGGRSGEVGQFCLDEIFE